MYALTVPANPSYFWRMLTVVRLKEPEATVTSEPFYFDAEGIFTTVGFMRLYWHGFKLKVERNEKGKGNRELDGSS